MNFVWAYELVALLRHGHFKRTRKTAFQQFYPMFRRLQQSVSGTPSKTSSLAFSSQRARPETVPADAAQRCPGDRCSRSPGLERRGYSAAQTFTLRAPLDEAAAAAPVGRQFASASGLGPDQSSADQHPQDNGRPALPCDAPSSR